jgi:hypothetical protein
LPRFELGQQGRGHAAEKARQALVARRVSSVLQVFLDEGGAQRLGIATVQ